MAKIQENTPYRDYTVRIEADTVYIKRVGNFWRGITISNTLEAWESCMNQARFYFPDRDESQYQELAAGIAWGNW